MHWKERWKFWRYKSYECPLCGWQGMCEPTTPLNDAPCPECGESMTRRTWWDTWGLTLLVLGIVAGVVWFVGHFGSGQFGW